MTRRHLLIGALGACLCMAGVAVADPETARKGVGQVTGTISTLFGGSVGVQGQPTGGQVLTWDATDQRWEADAGVGASNLDDLADVTAPTPGTGDHLRFDSAAWVNSTTATWDLSDVSAASVLAASDGDLLTWEATSASWEAQAAAVEVDTWESTLARGATASTNPVIGVGTVLEWSGSGSIASVTTEADTLGVFGPGGSGNGHLFAESIMFAVGQLKLRDITTGVLGVFDGAVASTMAADGFLVDDDGNNTADGYFRSFGGEPRLQLVSTGDIEYFAGASVSGLPDLRLSRGGAGELSISDPLNTGAVVSGVAPVTSMDDTLRVTDGGGADGSLLVERLHFADGFSAASRILLRNIPSANGNLEVATEAGGMAGYAALRFLATATSGAAPDARMDTSAGVGRVFLDNAGSLRWSSTADANGAPDAGIARVSSQVLTANNGGSAGSPAGALRRLHDVVIATTDTTITSAQTDVIVVGTNAARADVFLPGEPPSGTIVRLKRTNAALEARPIVPDRIRYTGGLLAQDGTGLELGADAILELVYVPAATSTSGTGEWVSVREFGTLTED